MSYYFYLKLKIDHNCCEIEDLVETAICKLCVALRSRVLRGVHAIKKYNISATLLTARLYQGQQGHYRTPGLRTKYTKPVLRGTKSDGVVE